ncbi:MAG: GAF domain-containing protein [Vulcanimicrobiota bacterium]
MNKDSYISKVDIKENADPLKLIVSEAKSTFRATLSFYSCQNRNGDLIIQESSDPDEKLLNIYQDKFIHLVEGWVLESRAPMIITDSSKDPRFLVKMQDFPRISILSFPIFCSEQFHGIISVHRSADNAFGSDSIKFIQNFARWAGKLIENSEQQARNLIQKKKLDLLNQITQRLPSIYDIGQAVKLISDNLKKILEIDKCSVTIFKGPSEEDKLEPMVLQTLNKGAAHLINQINNTARLVAPVIYKKRTLGFIDLTGEGLSEYLDVMNIVSSLLGASLERITISQEIVSRRKEFEALEAIARYETSDDLGSSSNQSRILDATLEIIVKLLKVERVNIMLYDRETDSLKVQAYWGVDEEPFGREHLSLGEGIAGHALKRGRFYQKNRLQDPLFVDSPGSQLEVNSLLAYPMIIEGRKIGVINVGTIYKDRVFTPQEIKMVSLVASRAALAIENSKLIKDQADLKQKLGKYEEEIQFKSQELSERGRKLTKINQKLKQNHEQLETLGTKLETFCKISKEISETADPEKIMDLVLKRITSILNRPMKIAAIASHDDNLNCFRIQRALDISPRYEKLLEVKFEEIPRTILDTLFKEKKSYYLTDFNQLSNVDGRFLKGLKSLYFFPLVESSQTRGILVLGSSRENDISDRELELIEVFSRETSLALNNARSRQTIRARIEKLGLLNKMNVEIDYSSNLQRWLTHVAKYASDLIEHEYALFFLYDQWDNLELKARYGADEYLTLQFKDQDMQRVIEEVIQRKMIFYSSEDYEARLKRYSLLKRFDLKSIVILPLQIKDQKIGAIILGSESSKFHTEQMLEFYELLATRLALTINNIMLFSSILLEKDRAKSVIESIKEGVVSIDWERKITAFNQAAEEMTGWKISEVIGKPCNAVFSCSDNNRESQCMENCPLLQILTSGETETKWQRSEAKLKTREQGEKDVSITFSLLSLDSDPVGGVMIFRDITEEKAYRERKSDYLAALSHDIFTPLTAIKGYTTTLLTHREKFDPSTQEEFIKVINSEIDRITRLLYNLMSLSRMETDRLQFNPYPQKLDSILEKIVDLYSFSTKNHEITIEPETYKTPQVFADGDHIEQILNNLVSNAIKYSPGGGKIIISAKKENEEFVKVRVIDQGIGIEPENLDKVFDRYHRVMNKKSRSVSGMGLGLYITRALVKMQKGDIWAENNPDGGTIFNFILPVFKEEKRRQDVRKEIDSFKK